MSLVRKAEELEKYHTYKNCGVYLQFILREIGWETAERKMGEENFWWFFNHDYDYKKATGGFYYDRVQS